MIAGPFFTFHSQTKAFLKSHFHFIYLRSYDVISKFPVWHKVINFVNLSPFKIFDNDFRKNFKPIVNRELGFCCVIWR